MADEQTSQRFSDLQVAVKSRILERLQRELDSDAEAATTMYTKSDGKNYGMYQKSEEALTDIYERVFGAGGATRQRFTPPPVGGQHTGG
jgi:hypothetical protein